MDKFFTLLSEVQREAYLQWMESIFNRIAELDEKIDQAKDNWELKRQLQNQKLEAERQLSISWFIENRLQQNPINFSKRCLAYQISFSLPPRREGFRTFRTHIKDAQNKVYIPGTEIKGAIRTSLLYSLLEDNKNYEILKGALTNFRSFFESGASPREKIERLAKIADAQSEDGLERKLLRGKEKDAKYDLFRLISISDTDTVSSDRLQISTILVAGLTRNIRVWAETLNPQTEFNFSFGIQEKAFLDKLGLEKLKDHLSLSKIFEACYWRSKEILEEEERYFSGERNILRVINELKRENQPIAPLLRLGWGQGFLGTTIGLKVKINDPDLYDQAIKKESLLSEDGVLYQESFPKQEELL